MDEVRRLARLRDLMVLDTPHEPVFDRIVQLASEVCGVPVALVSLVDEERQWFKANVGLPGVSETPRDVAFCAHAILGDEVFEVPDATQDPRFRDNPLVTGAPDIRFYAGAPLTLPGGERIGTLCVIDRRARQLAPGQAETLRALAAIASQALQMRRDLIVKTLSVRSEYEQALAQSEARYRAMVEEQDELVSLAQADGRLLYVNPAYARHFGRTPAAMLGTNLFDYIEEADREAVRERIRAVFETGRPLSGDNRMKATDGSERWVAWTNSLQRDAAQQAVLQSVGRDITERRRAELALRASQTLLARTGRVAGVGGWEYDLRTGAIHWSEETRRIHEVPPDYQPTLDDALAFYTPEARPVIEAAVQAALAGGQPWDLELPFVTARGRSLWVRALGEVDREDGVPVRLFGAFQDITERAEAEKATRLLTTVFDTTTDYVVQTDRQGRVTYMNPAARRATGIAPDAPLDQFRFDAFNTEATNALFATTIGPAVAARGVWIGETTVYAAGRREVPVSHMVIAHRDRDGRIDHYSGIMRDISAEQEARRQLLRQTATLRSVTEAIPAIVAVVGADERYRFVNSAFERWYGRARESIVGRTVAEVLGPDEYARSQAWLGKVMAGETVTFEKAYPGQAGAAASHLSISYIPLRAEDGSVDGFVGVAQDISSHKREEVRLLQLSQRDPLTGLLNRAGFQAYLERIFEDPHTASLALLYIDLDRFKPVNDRYGHPVGDQLLQAFAQRLRGLVRPTDAVARLGGDEFAIVLAGVRCQANAQAVAAKVVAAAQAPFELGALQVGVGASVGVAFGGEAGWRELVERADALLYRAKHEGRGRHAVG